MVNFSNKAKKKRFKYAIVKFSNKAKKEKKTLLFFSHFSIVRTDDWEIFPSDITMDDSIGGGAFGIVFSAYISRDVCKRLPYFQVHHKKLGRRGEFHRVAVKRVNGECQLILLHSILLYFNYAAMILAQ